MCRICIYVSGVKLVNKKGNCFKIKNYKIDSCGVLFYENVVGVMCVN